MTDNIPDMAERSMRDKVAVALYENAYPPEIRSGYEWDMVPGYWHEQADAALAAFATDGRVVVSKALLVSARAHIGLLTDVLDALRDWIASDDGPTPPLALVEKLEAFAEIPHEE